MPYDSQIEVIWKKLSTGEGSLRRPTFSRQSFRNVCDAFYQAEECPQSPAASHNIRAYRAEWNIWAYYFGEGVPFPGQDPASDFQTAISHSQSATPNVPISDNDETSRVHLPASSTTDKSAELMKATLESMWANNPRLKGYEPQLGWNPATGEPWLAIRCHVRNAFPALIGRNHEYLHKLERSAPEFRLRYERFPTDGYMLIWPEFSRPTDLVNQTIWAKLGNFRAFLEGWAASDQKECAPIHHEYQRFKAKEGSAALSLPNPLGFRPDVSRFRDLAYKVTNRRAGRR